MSRRSRRKSEEKVLRAMEAATVEQDHLKPQATEEQMRVIGTIVGAAHNLVVRFLKMAGVDPYSKIGLEKLGDPADWGEEIDETMCGAIEDAGFDLTIRAQPPHQP